MVKTNDWHTTRNSRRSFFSPANFFMFILSIGLLFGGIGIAQLLGGGFGKQGLLLWGIGVGVVVMFLVLLLHRYELALILVLAIHLYVDWYLAQYVVAPIMALGLLFIFFLARSPEYPWVLPRGLWLWALYLILTIYPALQGGWNYYDAAFYYPNIVVGALLIFWLGSVIARDGASVRLLFQLLASFGALIALHTILQAVTGITLLGTPSHDAFLAGVANYQLSGSGVPRVGSFFVDPNWNGAFFATIIFVPVGLFFSRAHALERLLYGAEMFLMLFALLFTYSNGAWVGTFAGAIVFVLVVGRLRHRVMLPFVIVVIAIVLELIFPTQVSLQIQHATEPSEITLRLGVWETALQVIKANPLTGIGLGHNNYLQHAEPYRVPEQYLPQDHPHNAYLEFAAMAGIPVLVVFVALLAYALHQAFRNWASADPQLRSVIGAGIAAASALTINSLTINGWTLPPLAFVGWLILGAISSPLLLKKTESGQRTAIPRQNSARESREDMHASISAL